MKTLLIKSMVLLTGCLFLVGLSNAVELMDSKDAPRGFVKMVEKDGKEEPIFATISTSFRPEEYDRIFKCYGLKIVDADKLPRGYASVSTDSNGKQIIEFKGNNFAYNSSEMNQLLEAYGLKLTDPKNTPKGYVKVAQDKDGREIYKFADGKNVCYPPVELNKLLTAYH